MPKNTEGVFYVSVSFLFTFSCTLYGFIPSLHHCHQLRASEAGPALLPMPRRWCCGFWIGSSAAGAGAGRTGGAPRGPCGHPAGLRGNPQQLLLSLQPSRIPFTPLAVTPEAQGRAIRVSFPTPRSPNLAALWAGFTNAAFAPPLRTGTEGVFTSVSQHFVTLKSPKPGCTHTSPSPARSPGHRGAAPGLLGAESIVPFSSPTGSSCHPEPPAGCGPCLQLGAAPRRVHRPPGAASEQTRTSEDVCTTRCRGEGNFIYFYWGFFYTLNLNKVFFT